MTRLHGLCSTSNPRCVERDLLVCAVKSACFTGFDSSKGYTGKGHKVGVLTFTHVP